MSENREDELSAKLSELGLPPDLGDNYKNFIKEESNFQKLKELKNEIINFIKFENFNIVSNVDSLYAALIEKIMEKMEKNLQGTTFTSADIANLLWGPFKNMINGYIKLNNTLNAINDDIDRTFITSEEESEIDLRKSLLFDIESKEQIESNNTPKKSIEELEKLVSSRKSQMPQNKNFIEMEKYSRSLSSQLTKRISLLNEKIFEKKNKIEQDLNDMLRPTKTLLLNKLNDLNKSKSKLLLTLFHPKIDKSIEPLVNWFDKMKLNILNLDVPIWTKALLYKGALDYLFESNKNNLGPQAKLLQSIIQQDLENWEIANFPNIRRDGEEPSKPKNSDYRSAVDHLMEQAANKEKLAEFEKIWREKDKVAPSIKPALK